MTTVQVTAPRRPAASAINRMQTRFKLALLGGASVLLALLVIAQASNAYQTAYNLFQSIAVVNSTNVNAAEEALQRLSNTSQATADYTALTSDTPLFEQAQNDIFRNFQRYRDQMFILQSNLQSDAEETAFTVADTYTYSRFWRHVSNLMSQRSNLDAARREYLFADAHLRNRIVPALQDLEALNFNAMVDAGQRAAASINSQVVLLAVLAVGLALLLTYLSIWLRGKVRRYLTPGIDLALIIGWVVLLLMIPNLLSLPGQLKVMTQDAYYSISGASRVLVVANQANRAESSSIIDISRKDDWYTQFDEDTQSVELRLCGYTGCLSQPFTASTGSDAPNSSIVIAARSITPADSDSINGVTVLMGNITFSGEATALENARTAFVDYLNVDAGLRQKIDAGDATGAVELNTGTADGSSEEAFNRFAAAMESLRAINRQVFDQIWADQQQSLPRNQVIFGFISYLLVIGCVVLGVYHRYREL